MRKIMMYLPDSMVQRLDQIAERRELTRSALVRQLIESALEK